VIEAAEEAILNSLFAATTTVGRDGHRAEAIPLDQILHLMKTYKRIP
jgi:D-aminopeptidase